ncbi:MAG: hypothetical protein WC878_02825 [Candidatus Paceibacterota bacterium]|jgi:hypothetical protein
MLDFILLINRYYDGIPEPWRFLILLALFSPVFFLPRLSVLGVYIALGWTFLLLLARMLSTLAEKK